MNVTEVNPLGCNFRLLDIIVLAIRKSCSVGGEGREGTLAPPGAQGLPCCLDESGRRQLRRWGTLAGVDWTWERPGRKK